MMRSLIFTILTLTACGQPGDPATPRSVPLPERPYAQLVSQVQDAQGWIETDRCDATLFSGLLGAAGVAVDLTAAEVEPGRWLRRPVAYPECFAAGESRSTISRDQLLGVLWWAWRGRRVDVLNRLWAYGVKHNWVMGEPTEHTVLNPSMLGLLARARHALGESTPLWARLLPVNPPDDATDYVAHLGALQLSLAHAITNHLGQAQLDWLEAQAERQPHNPLFPAVLGRVDGAWADRAATLLSDPTVWPEDRLPNTDDRCEPWVVQRDAGPDWEPCAPARTHSGGDWLFVRSLLEG